jgi:hypothetical protein
MWFKVNHGINSKETRTLQSFLYDVNITAGRHLGPKTCTSIILPLRHLLQPYGFFKVNHMVQGQSPGSVSTTGSTPRKPTLYSHFFYDVNIPAGRHLGPKTCTSTCGGLKRDRERESVRAYYEYNRRHQRQCHLTALIDVAHGQAEE